LDNQSEDCEPYCTRNEFDIIEVRPFATGGVRMEGDGAVSTADARRHDYLEPLIRPGDRQIDPLTFVSTIQLQVAVIPAGAAPYPGA
jgi:hypothetical protein